MSVGSFVSLSSTVVVRACVRTPISLSLTGCVCCSTPSSDHDSCVSVVSRLSHIDRNSMGSVDDTPRCNDEEELSKSVPIPASSNHDSFTNGF